jgi:hypothetical protein
MSRVDVRRDRQAGHRCVAQVRVGVSDRALCAYDGAAWRGAGRHGSRESASRRKHDEGRTPEGNRRSSAGARRPAVGDGVGRQGAPTGGGVPEPLASVAGAARRADAAGGDRIRPGRARGGVESRGGQDVRILARGGDRAALDAHRAGNGPGPGGRRVGTTGRAAGRQPVAERESNQDRRDHPLRVVQHDTRRFRWRRSEWT